MSAPSVPFSDLSKHSARVAATVERAHRVHVTRRDGEDLYLTTARHDREREEAADVAVRLVAALLISDDGVDIVRRALPIAFPWVRHLSDEEKLEFARDLLDATRDMTELDVPANLHRILVGWRATARILADPELAAQAMRPLPDVDYGEVVAP